MITFTINNMLRPRAIRPHYVVEVEGKFTPFNGETIKGVIGVVSTHRAPQGCYEWELSVPDGARIWNVSYPFDRAYAPEKTVQPCEWVSPEGWSLPLNRQTWPDMRPILEAALPLLEGHTLECAQADLRTKDFGF